MSLLVESIKILNGRIYNLRLHEERANLTRKQLYGLSRALDLRSNIIIPEEYKKGLVKCRIIYREAVHQVSFQPYQKRIISCVKIIENNDIDYSYKWQKRDNMDALFNMKGKADEIIIVKNGLLTDAYYYNIVCLSGKALFTPSRPLLHGVMREKLLNNKRIIPWDITVPNLKEFDRIYLVNALTPLGDIHFSPDQIMYE